jgi:hypothetical protein
LWLGPVLTPQRCSSSLRQLWTARRQSKNQITSFIPKALWSLRERKRRLVNQPAVVRYKT